MYDLLSINGYDLPDILPGKGEITVQPNPKYDTHDVEDGGKVIDEIEESEDMIMGTVTYNGLFQTQVSAINSIVKTVSTMTIYNPLTGSVRTFKALITRQPLSRIIHDDVANAWTFSFDFEEIGAVST